MEVECLQPEKFSKDSEQFKFFSKLWDFGKYAATCEHKDMYLKIGMLILNELKTVDFAELRELLNTFYITMCKYWNTDSEPNWQQMINESDQYIGTLSPERQEFMGNVFLAMMDGINDKYMKECIHEIKSR